MNIFAVLQEYKVAIFRRRWLYLLLMVVLAAALAGVFMTRPTLYVVRTSFVPEAQTGVANPLSALLSSSVAEIGGVGGASGTNMMVGAIMSSRIRKAIATDSVVVKGKKQAIKSMFMQIYPVKENILNKIGIMPVKPLQDTTKYIASILKGAIEAKPDKYNYIETTLRLEDNDLAICVAQSMVQQLGIYYRAQKTEKARYSLEYFEQKIDSVREQLDAATYANAHYLDRYKFSPYASSFIPREQATKKAEYLQGIYAQLLVSREQAVAQLLDETPVIQVLDTPELKEVNGPKIWLAIIVGIVLGVMLTAIINVWPKLRADISAYIATLMPQENA